MHTTITILSDPNVRMYERLVCTVLKKTILSGPKIKTYKGEIKMIKTESSRVDQQNDTDRLAHVPPLPRGTGASNPSRRRRIQANLASPRLLQTLAAVAAGRCSEGSGAPVRQIRRRCREPRAAAPGWSCRLTGRHNYGCLAASVGCEGSDGTAGRRSCNGERWSS